MYGKHPLKQSIYRKNLNKGPGHLLIFLVFYSDAY